jgi:predicted deacylase
MSEFAFFRFKSNNLLTLEEEAHKQEIINITEEVLDAKGIECDAKIAKISEEQLREILQEVRMLRRKRKRVSKDTDSTNEGVEEKEQMEEEIPYIK